MERIIITKNQMEAVQHAKKLYQIGEILEAHANTIGGHHQGWGSPELKALNGMSVSDLAQVLFTNNYDLKKEFPQTLKKGDYIKYKNHKNEIKVGIFDKLEGTHLYAFYNGNGYSSWVYSDKVEPSTKEEYQEYMSSLTNEIKRKAFSKLGRELNEVRVGDVIIVNDNVLLQDCGVSKAFHVHNVDVLVKAKHVLEKNLFTELFTPRGSVKSEVWLNNKI